MLHLRTHLLSPKTSSVSSEDFRSPRFTFRFLILGIAHLFFWNSLLNSLHDLNGPNSYATVVAYTTGIYNLATIAGLLLILATNVQLSLPAFYISSGVMAFSNVLVPLLYVFCPPETQLIWLYGLVVVGGLSSAFFQACGFGIAASMPEILSGWVSWGNGASGLTTGVIYLLMPFNPLIKASVLFTLGGIVCIIALVGMRDILKLDYIQVRLQEHAQTLEEIQYNPSMPSYRELYCKAWQACTSTFLVFFVSLLLFPTIIPFSLYEASGSQMNSLTVLFQVGDFLGRWSLVWFEDTLLVKNNTLLTLSLIRIGFILMVPLLRATSSWEAHVVYMVCLSLSNGWLASCSLMRGPLALRSFRFQPCRHKIASLQLLLLMCGVCLGLFLSPRLLSNDRVCE